MRTYQYWSIETLEFERQKLLDEVTDWERMLRETKSFLIVLSLTHSIKKAKEKIHAIEAELCFREHHKLTF